MDLDRYSGPSPPPQTRPGMPVYPKNHVPPEEIATGEVLDYYQELRDTVASGRPAFCNTNWGFAPCGDEEEPEDFDDVDIDMYDLMRDVGE